MDNKTQGWTWLFNTPKEHYFVNGQSLCGRWMCLGDDHSAKPDNPCKICLKKLEQMKGCKVKK